MPILNWLTEHGARDESRRPTGPLLLAGALVAVMLVLMGVVGDAWLSPEPLQMGRYSVSGPRSSAAVRIRLPVQQAEDRELEIILAQLMDGKSASTHKKPAAPDRVMATTLETEYSRLARKERFREHLRWKLGQLEVWEP